MLKLVVILVTLHFILRVKSMIYRENVNRILYEVGLNPMNYQTSQALKQQSNSNECHLVRKIQRAIQLFQDISRQIYDYLQSECLS